ncbi:MAG: aminopeptidase [Vallitaleaceae bacterium]|jgi:aminopeptidase|nr:aminopeptidase [Vallitaleaceae bacterium]
MDPRIRTLAHNLVNYSCKVREGEKVLINHIGPDTTLLTKAIIEEIYIVGGLPFEQNMDMRLHREMLLGATKEQIELKAKWDAGRMADMDCFIGVRGTLNAYELSDVPPEKMALYDKFYDTPIHHKIRIPKTRWVVLRYPTNAMAQLSSSSLDAFEDFYFNVCNLNYNKMSLAMDALVSMMNKTDKVRITGKGTDLTFSIKDIPAIKCDGILNIPDGEVFTAPVRDSINGILSYNTPAVFKGFTFEDITFEFKNGKIVKATANDTERINNILDVDEGARYIGEFAIGLNPYILEPMKETLFDEKIMGSIHMTPGNCYAEAPNGNSSDIHWDLVMIQRPEYGGGEIYFDDVLIRKDGLFVAPELLQLNPENLK